MSLATELDDRGHDAHAIEGRKSQFDVLVDGVLVFSKESEQRFPEGDEILAKL